MSDEEKKAIEMIEHIQECNTLIGYGIKDRTILAKALLNLIEKQSKEIEELKLRNEALGDITIYNQKNSVSKDKIKAKIEEVDIQLQKLKDGLTGRKTNFVNKNMLFAQKKFCNHF